MDDFVERPNDDDLVAVADFVKVDFQATQASDREALGRKMAARGIKMLAEKVETQDDLSFAVPAGYTFSRAISSAARRSSATKDIPAFRLNYLRLLHELTQPEISLHRLDEIMKQEMSIAYRILRYVNSVALGPRRKITSIREAIVYLGVDLVRKWTFIWALAGLGQDKPTELVVGSVIRGICCERLGAEGRDGRPRSRALSARHVLDDRRDHGSADGRSALGHDPCRATCGMG